jgi:hypothetical protein
VVQADLAQQTVKRDHRHFPLKSDGLYSTASSRAWILSH